MSPQKKPLTPKKIEIPLTPERLSRILEETSNERAKELAVELKGKQTLNTRELEAIGTMLIKERISPKEAEEIVKGKRIIQSEEESYRLKYSFENKGDILRIMDKDNRQVGNVNYLLGGQDNTHRMHIPEVFVEEEQRDKGYGTALMEEIEKIARAENMTSITLDVDRHNTDGLRFFERHGYSEVGGHDYGDGGIVDRVIMIKDLTAR